MKVMKTISFLSILVMAAVPAQGLVVLPHSTYGSANGWEGYETYTEDSFDVIVLFDVYDTDVYPTEFTWKGGVDMPDTDRYIYAYQIINNADSNDVGFFSVLNFDGSKVAQSVMHSTCSQEDSTTDTGVRPDPNVSTTQGEWVWSPVVGFVEPRGYSWFLIFSSDQAPVKGSFKVDVASDQGNKPVPEGGVPEPGTIALLGIASSLFIARRTKKRQSQ